MNKEATRQQVLRVFIGILADYTAWMPRIDCFEFDPAVKTKVVSVDMITPDLTKTLHDLDRESIRPAVSVLVGRLRDLESFPNRYVRLTRFSHWEEAESLCVSLTVTEGHYTFSVGVLV